MADLRAGTLSMVNATNLSVRDQPGSGRVRKSFDSVRYRV